MPFGVSTGFFFEIFQLLSPLFPESSSRYLDTLPDDLHHSPGDGKEVWRIKNPVREKFEFDREACTRGKTEFVRSVMQQAREAGGNQDR